MVSVSIPYQFSRTSSFTPLGKRIVAGIRQQLSVAPLRTYSSEGAAYAGHEYPVNIRECPSDSFAPGAEGVYNKAVRPGPRTQTFLPKQRHPLDPSKTVFVRTVRPNQHGVVVSSRRGVVVPISDPCVEQS